MARGLPRTSLPASALVRSLEELAVACREEGAYRFMLTVAPLNVPRGTGGPVNPIAVF